MKASTTLCLLELLTGFAHVEGDELSPRLSDSPHAIRIRELTLIGGTVTRSPEELARVKERVLGALKEALRARREAIEAVLLHAREGDESVLKLRAERAAILARENEVGATLDRLIRDRESRKREAEVSMRRDSKAK